MGYDSGLQYGDEEKIIPSSAMLAMLIPFAAAILYFLIFHRDSFPENFLWIAIVSEIGIIITIIYMIGKMRSEREAEKARQEKSDYFLELDQALKRRR